MWINLFFPFTFWTSDKDLTSNFELRCIEIFILVCFVREIFDFRPDSLMVGNWSLWKGEGLSQNGHCYLRERSKLWKILLNFRSLEKFQKLSKVAKKHSKIFERLSKAFDYFHNLPFSAISHDLSRMKYSSFIKFYKPPPPPLSIQFFLHWN